VEKTGHEGELHYNQTSSGGEFCPRSDGKARRKRRQSNIYKGTQSKFSDAT